MQKVFILLMFFFVTQLTVFSKITSIKPKIVFEGDSIVATGTNFDSKTNPLKVILLDGAGTAVGDPLVVSSKTATQFKFEAPAQTYTRSYLLAISGGNREANNPDKFPLVIFDIPDSDNSNPSPPDDSITTSNLITDLVTLDNYSLNTNHDGTLTWNTHPLISAAGRINAESFNINGIALASDKNGGLTWNSHRIATSSGALTAAALNSTGSKAGIFYYSGANNTTLIANGITNLYLPQYGYIPSFVRAEFDVSLDGGTTGSRNMRNATIPVNARVTRAYYEVLRTFTSATDSSLIGIGIASNDATGLLTPIAISDASNPWDQGTHACIEDGSLTRLSKKTTGSRNLQLVINGEALTAGKVVLFAEYVILP